MADTLDRQKLVDRIIMIIAITMSIYHLIAANFTIFTSEQHINLHIAFAVIIIFLQGIKLKNNRMDWKSWAMVLLIFVSAATAFYIHTHSLQFQMALGKQPLDKVLSGMVFLVVVLIATGKTWGLIIPAIAVIAMLYGYLGPHIPGIFFHAGLSFPRLITYVTTNFTGIYGMLASVSANTIVLFTIFGGLMEAFGAIQTIMDVDPLYIL